MTIHSLYAVRCDLCKSLGDEQFGTVRMAWSDFRRSGGRRERGSDVCAACIQRRGGNRNAEDSPTPSQPPSPTPPSNPSPTEPAPMNPAHSDEEDDPRGAADTMTADRMSKPVARPAPSTAPAPRLKVAYPENWDYRWEDPRSDTGHSSKGTGQDWCGGGWCGPSQCRLHWMMHNARIVEE